MRVKEETVDYLFTQYMGRFLILLAVEGVQSNDLGDDVRSVWDK